MPPTDEKETLERIAKTLEAIEGHLGALAEVLTGAPMVAPKIDRSEAPKQIRATELDRRRAAEVAKRLGLVERS